MKVFIISFGPNPRVVAKFQTDRFRTFGENRGEKINKLRKKPARPAVNHIRSVAATLPSAVAGGVNKTPYSHSTTANTTCSHTDPTLIAGV